jgi:hypothetical protein
MNYRRVDLDIIPTLHFSKKDVLTSREDKKEREHQLINATAFTMSEHEEVGLIARLETGEDVELVSNLIDFYEGEHVELRGGFSVPLRSILKVEL